MGLDFTSCKYMFNFKKLGPKVLLSSTNTRNITFLLQFWKEKTHNNKPRDISFKLFDSIPVNHGIL